MQRMSFLIPCAAIAFSVAAGTATAAVPLIAASNASAFNMVLNLDGQVVSLGRQVYVGGNAPPSYNVKNSVPSLSKSYSTPAGAGVLLAGGSINSTANSAGPSAGQITSDAKVTMGTLNATVSTPLGALISIRGANIVSHSNFTKTRTGAGTPVGNANIGSVVISAPLLGVANKSFSGAPKVNQVLFQSPDKSVTICLNKQTRTMAGARPTSLTVDAISIEFSKTVLTSAIGGKVVVGEAMAN